VCPSWRAKMPHRVVDFLRSSTHSIETQVSNLAKKKTPGAQNKRRHSPDRVAKSSQGTGRTSSALVCEGDFSDAPAPPYSPRVKMADARANSFPLDFHREHGSHHQHHRISFPGMHFGRSSKETSASTPATLDWQLESPPLVMYGDPQTSSGALLSGQL